MEKNIDIITNFYTAFQNQNAEGMVKHYSDDVLFEDPAFGKLKGKDAKNMWRMLCENGKDVKTEFQITGGESNWVTVHWEAKYPFSKTGRLVHNKIDTHIIIEDGLIVKHTDVFNLWQWSKQAMGVSGLLLGWSGFFRAKLQKTTHKMLAEYNPKH
jgi:ketosteroid isomerase-like protein